MKRWTDDFMRQGRDDPRLADIDWLAITSGIILALVGVWVIFAIASLE